LEGYKIMHHTSLKRSALTVALSLGVAGAFFAGVAYAHDAALDQAAASVRAAIASLKSAENVKAPAEFHGHRNSAITDLGQALDEIEKAEKVADSAGPTPKPGGGGPTPKPGGGGPAPKQGGSPTPNPGGSGPKSK
jgi:hypothetical protein